MRSPFVGLLLQHGHVHSPELARRLNRENQRPLGLRDALRRLAAPAAQRDTWHAMHDHARRLFPINSP